MSWHPVHVYVTSFSPTRNWPQGENLPLTASFTMSAKYFFRAIFHFTIFNAIISEFGECLTQSNIAQEQS